MTLSNHYIAPQSAAALIYAHARSGYTHAFTRLGMRSGITSFDKDSTYALTQTLRVELETYEPYQAYQFTVDCDLIDKTEGQIRIHGAHFNEVYVFESDADAIEAWLTQFRMWLRVQMKEDKNND
jgi:hypothetical protein